MIKQGEQVVVISKRSVPEGAAKSFQAKISGKIFRGFVVRKNSSFYAYENVCQHLAVTLDLNDNNFFTHDKRQLQCHMHGAIYQIETGLCTEGPCQGASLRGLKVVEEEDRIVIHLPPFP